MARKTLKLKKKAARPARPSKKPARKAPARKVPAGKVSARKAPPARKSAKARPTLHGSAFSGPTYKVALMFSLLGEPFAYRHVDMRAGVHKSPEHMAINRYGQVPAMVDGDLTLCQSGAILKYLAEKHKKFAGKDLQQKQRALE